VARELVEAGLVDGRDMIVSKSLHAFLTNDRFVTTGLKKVFPKFVLHSS